MKTVVWHGRRDVRVDTVRRGGTISIAGVYGGRTDPAPLMALLDKQVQPRVGRANVRRWTDELMPLVMDDRDPLGVQDLATHRLPIEEAPYGYRIFQQKRDGAVKVVLQP